MLYRGERENQESCHICKSSRWVTKKKKGVIGEVVEGKKKAAKVFRYFPLIPRLQRIYSTEKTSQDARWHDKERTNDEKLRHPADGEAWKKFDDLFPDFKADPRNIRLGLSTDGFNPFGMASSKHSTWPVILVPYSMPPWVCMKQSNFIMSMLIPGPKGPGNDIDIYLEPLVDELMQLWAGVDTYDVVTKQNFFLRAALLWTMHDLPAYAYLAGYGTSGKFGCPNCAEHTSSKWLKKGRKYCYMGHRHWLPINHAFRRKKQPFYEDVEHRTAPEISSGTAVLAKLRGRTFILGKLNKKSNVATNPKKKKEKQKRKRSGEGESSNTRGGEGMSSEDSNKEKDPKNWWKKESIFFKLPYWEFLKLRHNLDVIHIEKNICDNLTGTLLGDRKSKVNVDARLDLIDLGIQPDLHSEKLDNGRYTMPDACFTMSRESKEILCSIIKSIKMPYGYASNISRCVDMKECKFTGLKSHDCHILIEHLLPLALRSCYPSEDVMFVVVELSNFFKSLCSKVLDSTKLDTLKAQIVLTLCKMERLFIPSFFTIMVRLIVHLVDEAKLGGPVHYRWMYPFERNLIDVRNRAYPEGSIAEGYIADECLTFCSRFLKGIDKSSSTSINTNLEEENYLFDSFGDTIGSVQDMKFDGKTLIQAHRYVLRHIDELEDFRGEFIEEEKRRLKKSTITEPAKLID
ncbi:uncharacterized protein [Lolium perenne]|uniref:uncharacterized protein n=1 Tax=Lolium perenne TaxID=4522 RepID=UPI003A9A4E69